LEIPELPKIPKIQFVDSNWVVTYKVCGWIAFIVAVILLLQKQYMSAVYFVCMGLSSFLAAHVLRLLEKVFHKGVANHMGDSHLAILGAAVVGFVDDDAVVGEVGELAAFAADEGDDVQVRKPVSRSNCGLNRLSA